MSVPRMRAASAVVGDHMYVCGGVDASFRPHNSVERCDTLSEIWEAQPAMHGARTLERRSSSDPRAHLRGRRLHCQWSSDAFCRALWRRLDHGATDDSFQMSLLDSRHRREASRLWWRGRSYPYHGWSVLTQNTRRGSCSDRRFIAVRIPRWRFYGLRSAERFDPVTGRWEALPHMTVTGLWLVSAIHA